MYFLEFLETCTIGWVSFCEGGVGVGKKNAENAFFEFFLREVSTTPPPAHPIYPRGGEPSTPAHPDGLHSTGSSAGRTRTRAGQVPGQAHARTLARYTGLHSIPDRPRRVDRTGGGRWRVGNSSIMRIMIALSQAWYIDSNMNKYHKDILLFLVIVNYYLSIDTQPY